ncbi:MAG: PTS sugar transporter subunit IIA [Planctomycetaceae bacterium]|nr:PTS sugar transporter subunit IIA [Planctomycetaceae bacterium]
MFNSDVDSLTDSGFNETQESSYLPFTSVFKPNCIELLPRACGRSTVLSLLVERLAREERIAREHAEEIVRGLLVREIHGSTAIGKGIAFPHLRTPYVNNFVGAIGISAVGFQFGETVEPTRLVFLTLSPWDSREMHTEFLGRLMTLSQNRMMNFQLLHTTNEKEVYDYLVELDRHF